MTAAERKQLQMEKLVEMRAIEDGYRSTGKKFIAGIDEVGRGPLAGPVYAAAVVMPEDWDILGVNDSKKLSPKKREELSGLIRENAVAYGIGIADNKEIDELNILEATKVAMIRAVENCNAVLEEKYGAKLDQLLLDAVKLPIDIDQESMVKGDEKSLCIAAASIVAKVARDTYMTEIDEQYPGYDFARNKGYGTAAHYKGLREIGYSPIHRRSFLKKFEEEQAGTRSAAWGSSNKGDKMAKKVYAVRKGRETGIFTDWDTCKKQVDGFAGAEYKSFADPVDALAYLGLSEGTKDDKPYDDGVKGYKAYVDGSYDAANSTFSYGAVILKDDKVIKEKNQIYEDDAFSEHRNVAGEIMGAQYAVDYCLEHDIEEVTIFYDYEGIEKWANDEWKANTILTKNYKNFIASSRLNLKINFVKVKAHTGNRYNERADQLAKEALGL